jgi:hypothetical protein
MKASNEESIGALLADGGNRVLVSVNRRDRDGRRVHLRTLTGDGTTIDLRLGAADTLNLVELVREAARTAAGGR